MCVCVWCVSACLLRCCQCKVVAQFANIFYVHILKTIAKKAEGGSGGGVGRADTQLNAHVSHTHTHTHLDELTQRGFSGLPLSSASFGHFG